MKICLIILFLISLTAGCHNKRPDTDSVVVETFGCSKGQMKPAWYEFGQDEVVPKIRGLDNQFLVLVDTSYRARNFISSDEFFYRKASDSLGTKSLNRTQDWEELTAKQKMQRVKLIRAFYKTKADSVHALNNQGKQQVWVINNLKDTTTIQVQDYRFICILQALAKNGKWYPVQYWQFNWCGNSYYFKYFPPKTASSFVTKLPNLGEYETKLRYKLMGINKFYYSNQFNKKINYCDFVEDSTSFIGNRKTPRPHFKLDSLIRIAGP